MSVAIFLFVLCTFLVQEITGHGLLIEPPNRSTLWKHDKSAVPNYNENQVFCGGYYVQWELNDGKCGVCGDTYTDPHPQDNENTGIYGQGKIVRVYNAGSIIDVEVNLTKNHLGYFEFSLCELENENAPEPGEECFQVVPLANGLSRYNVPSSDSDVVSLSLQLPNQSCKHCVLRWHYHSGNNWGDCGDGIWGPGCGPQETFRNCADVSIV